MYTIEAEYIVGTKAIKEAIWLKGLVRDVCLQQDDTDIVVFCDSQDAIHLINNLMYHEKTEHIDVKYHFIHEIVSQCTTVVKKVVKSK